MHNKLLLFALLLVEIKFSSAQVVQLPNGQIQGREAATFANTSYYAFQKIPFAAPPVGDLRFKAPQPAPAWDGVLDTTVLDATCFQMGTSLPTDAEDCLYLNVFTPMLPGGDDDTPLPVMLFIFGGLFNAGTSLIYPPDLFLDNGVIFVSINYRLGPFGFLSTEDTVIPGNNGLKDQRLAIQWTHDNIDLFGGDPDKITIFGQGAGSVSVGYQLLNQNSNGLIKGAIYESGTFLSPWAYQRSARAIAFGTGSVLNSTFQTNTNSQQLLEFLQTVDAADLNAAAEEFQAIVGNPVYANLPQAVMWAPVIEVKNPDAFITKKMYGLLQAGNILPVPTMIGFTSEESLYLNPDPDVFQAMLAGLDQDLSVIVPGDMEITSPAELALMGAAIRNIYTLGGAFADNLGAGSRWASDNLFTRATIKHVELFSKVADIFFYQFSYDGPTGGISVHYDGADSVGDSEELNYLFCYAAGCDPSNYPEADQLTQQRLITLWTNFAKYQNPTPEPLELLQNVTWPAVDTEMGDVLYLNIGEDLEVLNHAKEESYVQWSSLYDTLLYNDFDTY